MTKRRPVIIQTEQQDAPIIIGPDGDEVLPGDDEIVGEGGIDTTVTSADGPEDGMTYVVYRGHADVKRVAGHKFSRRVPTPVSKDLAQVLLAKRPEEFAPAAPPSEE